MVLNWHNDRSGSMYCSTSLEANWYEERFQNASGSNVGARIEGRAHHEEPPTKVTRERDASLSAPLAGGLDVLTCIAREPLPSSDRTMHTPEIDSLDTFRTTAGSEMGAPASRSTVNRLLTLEGSSMISDATFSETMRPRDTGAPTKGFGATVPSYPADHEARQFETTTRDMQTGGVVPNHPTKQWDALDRLMQEPEVTDVRGGFEKAGTNRLAVMPRLPKDSQPRPLVTQDFRRLLGPQQGHNGLCPPIERERIARKSQFPPPADLYLRPGKQIWSES